MTKWTSSVGAAMIVTLAVCSVATAEIPEPDHIFWGTASYFGEELSEGEVTVSVNDDPMVLASYEVGSNPELGPQFVLRVPLDSTGARLPNSARRGDLAKIFINGELAGEKVIGDRGSVTKLDIDPAAISFQVVDIGDAQIVEGDAGQQEMVFTVDLSEAVAFDVTVNYTTADGTATSADGDYVPENGVVEFGAGDTQGTLSITVNGDTTIEPDETLVVNLTTVACSGEEGCTPPSIGDGYGAGTILDDDTPPSISAGDVTVTESESTVQAIFRISLSHVWDQDVSVSYATADGTAEAGADYLSVSGVATILQGALVTTVAVDVLPDALDEDNETFVLDLSAPVNGSLLDSQGTATILDDQNFLIYRGQQKNGVAGVQGLDGSWGLNLSPDGDHLYAVSETDYLVIFARDEGTGDLTFVTALQDGVNGIDGLDGARDVVVSEDGSHVYVASAVDQSVAVFERNTNELDAGYGTLTPIQTVTNGDIQTPNTVDGLVDARRVILSPDPDGDGPEEAGTHVYVVGRAENAVGADVGSVAVFSRDAGSGELTFVEVEIDGVNDDNDFGPTVAGILGATDVAISADGAHLYVTGELADSVAVFQRDTDSSQPTLFGRLTYMESYANGVGTPAVTGLEEASSVEVSGDGAHVYVTGRGGDGGVALFARNADDGSPDFGKLTFGSTVASTMGNGLVDVIDSRLSVDGTILYTTSFNTSMLSVFRRGAGGALQFIEMKEDAVGGVDGLFGARRLAVSSDDRHIYATGNFDDALAIFVRDLDAPNNPVSLGSTSHTVDVWSGNPIISVQWSGASDEGHAGLAGYSVVFDTDPATVPDGVVDVVHEGDTHSTDSQELVEGESHYFHLRSCDNAGNCSGAMHLGPFKIDLTAPTDPTAVVSDSHEIGVPSTDTRITMRWSGAADAASGLAGYGYTFTVVAPGQPNPPPVPSPVCTGVQAVADAPGEIMIESAPLFNGRYFFHLCTQDLVGNWSAGITPVGPYVVQSSDAAAPTVDLINTVASMDDGELNPDDLVFPTVTQIVVDFSEVMFDSADLSHPNTVRNTANYALVADGDDEAFTTTTCGAVMGDDIRVFVDSVMYEEIASTAALVLNGGFALPPDSYRLILCDELFDESGNSLDGDLNGTAGGEVVQGFEVDSFNLLLNPNFDIGDLSFWVDTPEGTPDVAPGLDFDAGGAFSSNSVRIDVIPSSEGTSFSVSQCVPLTLPSDRYEISGWVWMEPDDPAFEPTAVGTVKFFTGGECDETQTGSERRTNIVVGSTDGFWNALLAYGYAPGDGASALVTFVVNRDDSLPDPETVDAYFDDLYFGTRRIIEIMIFEDGFEGGGLGAWTAVSP